MVRSLWQNREPLASLVSEEVRNGLTPNPRYSALNSNTSGFGRRDSEQIHGGSEYRGMNSGLYHGMFEGIVEQYDDTYNTRGQ